MNKILDIKELRRKMKFTQGQLAEECGVDLRTVQNWEKGKNIPESMRKLLEVIAEKYETVSQSNTISNTGAFSKNTINEDFSAQLSELINEQRDMRKDFMNLMSEKNRQINELIEIIKKDNDNI